MEIVHYCKALLPIKQVELIKRKEFIVVAFDSNNKTFVVYIASLTSTNIHSFCTIQIALLIQNNTSIVVSSKYTDFANIFFPNLATKLLKQTGVNNYLINLVKD